MRLVLIQGLVGGISITILVFAILLQYLIPAVALITYMISVGGLVVLVVISIISSFTQKIFIHPDDRLWSNTFTYILFMAVTLALGHFFNPAVGDPPTQAFNESVRSFSYEAGAYVLITFVLIYLILFFSRKIGFHELIFEDSNKREKELVARFILFSILLGAVLVGLKYLLDKVYDLLQYTGGVWVIMSLSLVFIILISVLNWKKYSPITDETKKAA